MSKIKNLIKACDDGLRYGPALPFMVLGYVCNQLTKWVVGGFILGWIASRDFENDK